MQINWAPEHCDALRDCLAKGMSHSESADAINARFATSYSRNAAIGRAKRMGLAVPDRPKIPPRLLQQGSSARSRRAPAAATDSKPSPAVCERSARVQLRCVQIIPRHLSLIDLEADDCRYPYGGDVDGEAITFCAHPQHEGSSYCIGHFHLSRGPGTASERAAVPFALWLVEAA